MTEIAAPQPLITEEMVPKGETLSADAAMHLGSGIVAPRIDISWLPQPEVKDTFIPDFEKVFGVLDRYKDTLSDPQSRLKMLKEASPDALLQGLDELHSLMTPDEVHEMLDRPAVVGANIKSKVNPNNVQHVTSQIFIDPADRSEFLEHAHNRLGTVDSVEQSADIISFAVLNLHAYSDGNGRTARLLHTLMKDGYDGSDEAKRRIQEFATPRDAVKGMRPMSFNVEHILKQALIDGLADTSQHSSIRSKFEDAAAFEDKNGSKSVSANILESALSKVKNVEIKKSLIRVLQQSDFGDAAMENIIGNTEEMSDLGTVDTYMRLGALSDEQATQIIDFDRQTRFAYMKQIIDIAAGDKVSITNRYTGQEELLGADGLTMSTAWQAKYLAAA